MNKKLIRINLIIILFLLIQCVPLRAFEVKNKDVTIAAVGDIMFHMPQVRSAFNGQAYDFRYMFKDVKTEVSKADISIGNFETTINPKKKFSGYPRFNSPESVLTAIKDAGFDILSTANNHTLDTGLEGMLSTRKLIEKHGIIPIGTGSSKDRKFTIIEKSGIKIGVLSYTQFTNFIKAPGSMVNYSIEDKISKDIKSIKNYCDYVIIYIHAGEEYNRDVTEYQYKLYRKVADMGADCIIGSHPHVVSKSEIYNSKGRKVYINYSLGNFISCQKDKYTDFGAMIKIKINIGADKKIKLKSIELLPTYRLKYSEKGIIKYKVIFCNNAHKYIKDIKEKMYIAKTSKEIIQMNHIGMLTDGNKLISKN